jgi:hypothetical protein
LIDAVIGQLALIANVQDARREAGLSALRDESVVVRQVKRPAASADVDFQVYTLQQAIAVMPIRRLPREKRIELADQLAFLGVRSDGWTATGAAATLIDLGALKYAVEVVDHIAVTDPTRAEGLLSLVRGLLAVGEESMAATQAERALEWARSRADRNPERAIIWGLAEIYLTHGQPKRALHWLEQWRKAAGWRQRFGSLWRNQLDDDELRLGAFRLRALLQQGQETQEITQLLTELRTWAPRLLDGEALINFMLDSLLRPLLAAGRQPQAWPLLTELVQALTVTSGNKHSAHVEAVAALLAQQVRLAQMPGIDGAKNNGAAEATTPDKTIPDQTLWENAERLLADLWKADARRSAWQAVHSLEGSLPLILALEGPSSVVALARAANECLWLWA